MWIIIRENRQTGDLTVNMDLYPSYRDALDASYALRSNDYNTRVCKLIDEDPEAWEE